MSRPRVAVAAVALLASACGSGSGASGAGRLDVVASFYPLAFVAERVGGEHVEVTNLTPPGAEPHDLELTPGQVRALASADLVLFLGAGFQPSVEDALGDVRGETVDVLSGQDDLLEPPGHGDDHDDGDEPPRDPHVWLDPLRTAAIGRLVAERLGDADPGSAGLYRANAAALEADLRALDSEYRKGLADCERRSLVTSHEAFGYLTAAYRLDQVGIAGIDPEAEPSAARLTEVVRFVRSSGATMIFFEVLVSPAVAQTLARETGAATARLDPIEGPPHRGDYLSAMRANLTALRAGLGCS
ncbi:MAG: metal ABC transporter substrate-binding protein [Actinomycetota bacterium]